MGKREIGTLGVIDLIVSVLIAEIVAIGLENREESNLFSDHSNYFISYLSDSYGFFILKKEKSSRDF